MTDTSPADRYAWRTSADTRDEVILLDVLVIYRMTVHGSREGTRFYADRD
jgi:hypothetical protein